MTERGREPAQPGAAPSPEQAWSARMDSQPASPGEEPGAQPTWASGTPRDGTAPIAPAGSKGWVAPGTGRRRRGAAARPGQPSPRRRRSAAVAWWALGALLLTAAAVAAILFGDGLTGDPSAAGDQQKTKATPTLSTEPALPTLTESVPAPTDTGLPTDTGIPPTDPSAPQTATDASSDPLGLGVPMTPPACDGTWIIILGSAIDPATYTDDVTALLGIDPEAKYVLTEGQCASLRQATDQGNQIYAVWIGAYPDQQSACDIRNGIGGGVYVKKMDDTTPPTQTYTC